MQGTTVLGEEGGETDVPVLGWLAVPVVIVGGDSQQTE